MDYKEFKYNALKNNTFNLKAVEKSLDESKMSGYQYLRQFQLDSTGYKRFDFGMQDIYRTNKINHNWKYVPRRWLFYIDHEFINVGKRIAYKRSALYEKDLSYNDVINHPELFDDSFLVFVDGKLYTEGVKILCKEDKTYMIFECKEKPNEVGFPIKDMREYLINNVNVSIIFVPNVGIKNIQTNGYKVKRSNNYEGIPLRTLNLSDKAVYDDKTLTYVKFNNEVLSTPTTVEFTTRGIYVDQDTVQYTIDSNPKDTSFTIQIIPLRYLFDKITVGNQNKWFELPLQNYPIAVENCLVFDMNGNFLHDAKVKHYYPNIYSIENIDEIIDTMEVQVYVFYYKRESVLKHEDMLSTYHKYVTDYFEKYKDGTINPLIKDFDPEVVEYSIKDFNNHESYDKHFRYKIIKMREFIKADVNNFRRYLNNLGLRNNYYYVDVTNINLEERKRTDNSDTGLVLQEFDEEMYMFVFRNDFRGMYDKLLIHVDGIRYETLNIFETDKYDFVYIPCGLVKEDTVIEIEKLTEVLKEFEFTATEDIITMDIGEFAVRNKTLFNDLFLVDKETSHYLDPEDYEIIYPFEVELDDITERHKVDYILSDSSYYQIDELTDTTVTIGKYDEIEEEATSSKIITNDELSEGDKYELNIDIENQDANFTQYNGTDEIVKYVQSKDDPLVEYCFRIRGNKVVLDILNRNSVSGVSGEIDDEIEAFSLDDVFLPCPRKVKLKITNPEYIGKQLVLHIKKNFRYAAMEVQEEPELLEPIIFSADMKNDRRYIRVYRNGRLVPRHLGGVKFPLDYSVGEMEVYPGTTRNINDKIIVELMPYMMNQVCYLETIPKDQVIDLTGLIDKPFDFKWHDIYINGRKLAKKEVEVISANRIKLLKTDSLRWLEIVENSRDKEYFGFVPVLDILDNIFENDEEFRNAVNDSINPDDMQDIEDPIIDIVVSMIDYILRRFYTHYLVPEYGLINPDELQIDEYTIKYYNEILSKDEPFVLNPDIGRLKEVLIRLPINPDFEGTEI